MFKYLFRMANFFDIFKHLITYMDKDKILQHFIVVPDQYLFVWHRQFELAESHIKPNLSSHSELSVHVEFILFLVT